MSFSCWHSLKYPNLTLFFTNKASALFLLASRGRGTLIAQVSAWALSYHSGNPYRQTVPKGTRSNWSAFHSPLTSQEFTVAGFLFWFLSGPFKRLFCWYRPVSFHPVHPSFLNKKAKDISEHFFVLATVAEAKACTTCDPPSWMQPAGHMYLPPSRHSVVHGRQEDLLSH